MIKSMTGFGRGEYADDKRTITVEIRAVNHRYCDVFIKAPKKYSFAEEKMKTVVKGALHRGKIEVSLYVDNFGESDSEIRFDEDLAKRYYEVLQKLRSDFVLDGDDGISLELLASMPDVIKAVPAEQDEEEMLARIGEACEKAVKDLCDMRGREGERLAEDILKRVDIIEGIRAKIIERAPQISKEYMEKVRSRIDELLEGKVEIDEDRILLEAAIFADKANITEELVRLDSHLRQMRSFIAEGDDSIGKKMDFLVQEMNREANTIGSKSNDTEITKLMLDMKAEIEKIREQVQNIS